VTPTSRREYAHAVRQRYAKVARAAKSQILDEFCATTGYHRKYAIDLLTKPAAATPPGVGGRRIAPRRLRCSRPSGRPPAIPGPSASKPSYPCGCLGPNNTSPSRRPWNANCSRSAPAPSIGGSRPALTRLMTLPGVGFVLGLVILLEVGDVHRFPDAPHLAAYAGTTPRVDSSGGKVRFGRSRPERRSRQAHGLAAPPTAPRSLRPRRGDRPQTRQDPLPREPPTQPPAGRRNDRASSACAPRARETRQTLEQ
jgi:transposase IS116/IS110/IS902 family protein